MFLIQVRLSLAFVSGMDTVVDLLSFYSLLLFLLKITWNLSKNVNL